jgi:hypothetical protein
VRPRRRGEAPGDEDLTVDCCGRGARRRICRKNDVAIAGQQLHLVLSQDSMVLAGRGRVASRVVHLGERIPNLEKSLMAADVSPTVTAC